MAKKIFKKRLNIIGLARYKNNYKNNYKNKSDVSGAEKII